MGIDSAELSGGEIIAQILLHRKVKFLFTLCGGHISPIFVAAKQLGIRVIDTRHEANAVFAADAVSRISGNIGVAVVTAGPGVTNSITPLKNALLAQSPLILLGGSPPTLLKGKGALQDIDHMQLLKSSVKWSVAISKKKDLFPVLNKAFNKAIEGVPGPVFVELPVDLLYPEVIVREWYGKASKPGATLKSKISAWYVSRHLNNMFSIPKIQSAEQQRPLDIKVDQAKVEKVGNILSNAKSPVMLIGSGAMMQPGKADLLAKALVKIGIPVYLSGMARGLLGNDNSIQYRHKRRNALKEADVVLLAGVPCDFRLDYGKHLGRAKFIGINRSKTDLTKNRMPDVAIHGDPMEYLLALASLFSTKSSNWDDWKLNLSSREAEREAEINQQAEISGGGINPITLFKHLDANLPEDCTLIADGGDFVGTASYILKPRKPLSWLDPGVFGTLGVGGGFALGAKLCKPASETYIIYGDGSSAFSLMEVDTFTRHNLPVIIIIGNDGSWSQIARDQIEILGDSCATELANSDYEKIAHAFGANGKKVSSQKEFERALLEAKRSIEKGQSYVINAVLAQSDFRKGSLSM